MSKRLWSVIAGMCGLGVVALSGVSGSAQTAEVKEKPPMYSYIANWQIPRAQWGEMEKADAADKAVLDKALADGTIVGYGNDEALIHTADGATHDDWWASTSMAGLLKVLDQLSKSGSTTSSVLQSATKHWDEVVESRYYNWHPGPWKDAYVSVSSYKLKADASDDAVDSLSKHLVAPMLEKLLADGTLHEYEIDVEAIHTDAPGTFSIVYVAAGADGVDKVNAAITEAMKAQPLSGPAFVSMVDLSAHRDELLKGEGVFK